MRAPLRALRAPVVTLGCVGAAVLLLAGLQSASTAAATWTRTTGPAAVPAPTTAHTPWAHTPWRDTP